MNSLPSRRKQCHFNLTWSLLYLVKLKIAQNGRLLTAVRSVESTVQIIRRKLFYVPFVSFPVCYKILAVFFGREKFYICMGFIKNLSSNSMWLILACELKLNCRDLRRVTVMTSSSNWVSKLHLVVKYSFLFSLVEELQKSTKKCESHSRKYVVPFHGTRCI